MSDDYPTMPHNLENLIPKLQHPEIISSNNTIDIEEDLKFSKLPSINKWYGVNNENKNV